MWPLIKKTHSHSGALFQRVRRCGQDGRQQEWSQPQVSTASHHSTSQVFNIAPATASLPLACLLDELKLQHLSKLSNNVKTRHKESIQQVFRVSVLAAFQILLSRNKQSLWRWRSQLKQRSVGFHRFLKFNGSELAPERPLASVAVACWPSTPTCSGSPPSKTL